MTDREKQFADLIVSVLKHEGPLPIAALKEQIFRIGLTRRDRLDECIEILERLRALGGKQ